MTGFRLFWLGVALAVLAGGCGRDEFATTEAQGPIGPGPDDCIRDADCGRNQYCDRGTCRDDIVDPPVCRDGTFRCLDELTVGYCPDGGGFEVWEDCGAFGSFCADGQCVDVPPVCDAGAVRCGRQGNVEICTGDRWEDLGTCPPNSRCVNGDCQDVGNLPDIQIAFAEVQPDAVEQGGTIDLGLEVINDGPARAGGFECLVGLATGEPNPNRDVVLERVRMGPLGSFEGQGVGLRVQIPRNVAPRPYNAYVFCDARDEVRESDEDNNIELAGEVFVLPAEGLPDLEIVDLGLRVGGRVDAGESIAASMAICNFGEGVAQPTTVRLHALPDPNSDRIHQLLGEWGLNRPLQPGECQEISVQTEALQCFDPRVFFVRAVVDPQNRVQEANERNNTALFERPIEVVCDMMGCVGDPFDPEDVFVPPRIEPDLPHDLILCPGDTDSFELPWETGAAGQLVVFSNDASLTVQIRAILGDAISLVARGDTGEMGVYEFSADRLPRANRFDVVITGPAPPQGAGYTLIASGGDVLPSGIDLSARTVTMTPEPYFAGEQKTVRFVLANNGDVDAGASFSGIAIVPGHVRAPDPEDYRFLLRFESRGLAAGAQRSEGGVVRLPEDLESGPYTVVIIADLVRQVPEFNENNNVAVLFFDVTAQTDCEEDGFEPNNSFQGAVTVDAGVYPELFVCENDDDFYRICPGAEGALSISVRFVHSLGDIDIELLDERQETLERRNGVQNEERIDYDGVAPNQCYILRVYLFGQRQGSNLYEMELSFEGQMMDTCTDPFEANNGFDATTDIGAAADDGRLDFCPQGDPDYYVVPLARGDTLTVGVMPGSDDPGSISISLYGPNRGFLLQRFERQPVITFQAATEGDHFLRLVTSSGADRFPYSFTDFSIE